ncbi:RNASEH1 [Mytilus edulis]|uniref:RnhA n=1 Tax=Mytilus edulis TaxID=6550 RepID=A0A8S3T2B4_MYTED|nr:RNASEH1 [Mytilus edulis]
MTQSKPLYWSRLGNSKSRTNEQQELCQETINQPHGDCTQEQAISFTDGSCLGNTGPCGAGAIIYAEHIKPCLQEYIDKLQKRIHPSGGTHSNYHVKVPGLLTLNWAQNSYISVIREIKENIEHLRQKGLNVIISWTPGHANIAGNDEADILAKTAAEEAKELPTENNVITLQDVKQAAYKSTGNKWQRRWEISERGRDLYEKIPTTKHSIMSDFPTKRHLSIFAQLRTGYTELNYYKNRVGQTNAIESCNCGAPETPHHFLLESHYQFKAQRRKKVENAPERKTAHWDNSFQQALRLRLKKTGHMTFDSLPQNVSTFSIIEKMTNKANLVLK